jgi:hypothetical protein
MGQLQLRFASPLPLRAGTKNETKKAVRACDNVGRVAQVEDLLPCHHLHELELTLYLGMVLRTISVIGKVVATTKWAPPGLIIRIIGFV